MNNKNKEKNVNLGKDTTFTNPFPVDNRPFKFRYDDYCYQLSVVEFAKEAYEKGYDIKDISSFLGVKSSVIGYNLDNYEKKKEILTKRISLVDDMWKLIEEGFSSNEIAEKYNCTRQYVSKILTDKKYVMSKTEIIKSKTNEILNFISANKNKVTREMLLDMYPFPRRNIIPFLTAHNLLYIVPSESQHKKKLRDKKIIELYNENYSVKAIMKEVNVGRTTVNNIIAAHNQTHTFERNTLLMADYSNGMSKQDIAEKYNLSHNFVITLICNLTNLQK